VTLFDWPPWKSILGGGLIGLGASVLLVGMGRIAGISGITASLALGRAGDRLWRALFLAGLVAAGSAFALMDPDMFGASPRSSLGVTIAGLLVGFGTRLGSGCTSGHGICGISRMSPRSLVATLTFMLAGAATVAILRWTGGAS
jgi:uncharacterized membrane protein YedE/YeeE